MNGRGNLRATLRYAAGVPRPEPVEGAGRTASVITAGTVKLLLPPRQSRGISLRIRVKEVLDLLAAGASRDEILHDYPFLEAADITATLEYAATQSDHPVLRVA